MMNTATSRAVVSLILGLLAVRFAMAQSYVPGGVYFGRANYIEYRAGELPVILVSGHGGDLEPREIPERTYGTKVTDTNTRELAVACFDEIVRRTGLRPHLVISHLHRNRLDPNREIVEAAQGDAEAERAWNDFHGFIAAARASALSAHGFAQLIDLHGHGHDIPRLELGYALGADELNHDDATLENPGFAWMSTLRSLRLAQPGRSFPDLLRGSRSLGSLFVDRGVDAWPSAAWPSPGDAQFFNGGHVVRTHSCLLDNETVSGVQIESHYAGVRDSGAARSDFAAALCQVLQPWLYDNYGYSIGTLSLYRMAGPDRMALEKSGPPVTITVERSGYTAFSSTLELAFGGDAVAGADYTTSANALEFASRQTSASFTITPAAAGTATGDKRIIVSLAPNLRQSAYPAPVTLTLGDGAGRTVRVSAVSRSVGENAGDARFIVSRTGADIPLSLSLTWSGTASPGADYRGVPDRIDFAAGVSSLEVAVPLVNDGRPEADKDLVLTAGPVAGWLVGPPSSATVTIVDDDRPAGLAVWLRGDLADNVAHDSSGHERHAAALPSDGGPASGPLALTGPAIRLDGVDDTLALPRFVADPDGAFTLAFFFSLRPEGTIGSQNLASLGTRFADGSLHVYLATTNAETGTVALRTNLPDLASNALDVSLTSPESWQDDAWHHYALTADGDGTVRVYVDGVLRRTATGRAARLSSGELFWLGWRPASGPAGGFMSGSLRDVRAYTRSLPAAEISALATERLTFAAWASANGLPADTQPTHDLGGNPALLDYALGSTPGATITATGLVLNGDRLELSFTRESSAADLTWEVEGSDDLATGWQTLARRASGDSAWSILATGVEIVEINDHATVRDAPRAKNHRFLRVRVITNS